MEHIIPEPQRPFSDDAETQFTQLFDSITMVLAEAAMTWADVIDMTSWHTDMTELPVFQQVRDRYVVEPWPAWTAVGTTGLALPDARAEVRIVARRP
ncbi:MAG: Rid family hydrolase [Actinomycetota bacterium]